jgi:hypothetical protein
MHNEITYIVLQQKSQIVILLTKYIKQKQPVDHHCSIYVMTTMKIQ